MARHVATSWHPGWYCLQPPDRCGNGDVQDLVILIAHHLAELLLDGEVDCLHAEACPEDSIERGRRTSALQMAEHARADFLLQPGPIHPAIELTRDCFTDASQAVFTGLRGSVMLPSAHGTRAFCDDDQAAGMSCLFTRLQRIHQPFVVKGNLRKQDDIRSPGEAAVQGDPSSMAPHRFDDHHALVRAGSGMQAVERVGHAGDGAVESERGLRCLKVVVDRFWNADDADARFEKLLRCAQGTIAADRDQCMDAALGESLFRARDDCGLDPGAATGSVFANEVAPVRGPENGPAALHDSFGIRQRQFHRSVIDEQPFVAVAESHDFPIQARCRAHHATQDRVQPRTIAAARQDADCFLIGSPSSGPPPDGLHATTAHAAPSRVRGGTSQLQSVRVHSARPR